MEWFALFSGMGLKVKYLGRFDTFDDANESAEDTLKKKSNLHGIVWVLPKHYLNTLKKDIDVYFE